MSGYTIVNALGCLLLLTSLWVVLTKSPKKSAFVYSVQSLVLVAIFISLGATTGSTELFTWSGTAFLTKVIFVPAVVLFMLKKMGEPDEDIEPVVKPVVSVMLAIVEFAICFAVVQMIDLPAAAVVKPALAVSLAHFFIGLTCIVSQRNIVKQMFGYCLMENGSHLTLALLAPQAPELVEIGIATDAIFAVLIMAVICYRVYKNVHTLNSDELMELKG
ncbi:MAG: hydrogenase 4 membrane subunit [Phoenicibacter congonensis]|uniref:Hydrogenase 4 membrane subunit n=1 Tax=Phoenicibacter congonensis TaxID=1944646 RepID=A0AA43RJR1_9ACTN|nr:hydrogenase 4 membrane subunit [Phoenicibacter congonensis]